MLSRRATVAGVPLGDLSFAKIISARSDARLAKRNQLGFCKLLAWMKEDSRHEQSERSFDKRINAECVPRTESVPTSGAPTAGPLVRGPPSAKQSYARVSGLTEGIRSSITKMRTSIPQDLIDYSNSRKATRGGDHHFYSDMQRS